jgi:sensor histidine kinase YesM
MKIRQKFFFSFLILIAIPTLAFCFILLFISGSLIEDRTLNASVVVVHESVKRVENKLDDYHNMTMQVYFHSELMESLAASSGDEAEQEKAIMFSREILKSFVNANRYLISASIMTENFTVNEGSSIIGLDSLMETYSKKIYKFPGRLIWIPTTPMSTVFGLDSRYFGVIRLLRKNGITIGTLMLLVREEFFHDSEAGELPMKGSLDYIITPGGQLISSPDPALIGTILTEPFLEGVLENYEGFFISEDKNNYIVYRKSTLTGWIFIRILERDAVLRHLNSLKTSLLILIGLFILFLVILSYFFSNGLAKPLSELTRQIDYFGEDSLTLTLPGVRKSNNEIDRLSSSIKAMAGRINSLIEKVSEEEQLKAVAELKALRSQLNPHFVYNTLNTIRWMAAVNRQSNIEETVIALIALMRSALDMDRKIIPLKEEINILQQYVLIQKKRYREFQFEIDIPDDIQSAGINKFMIQPFVENSLIHGFKDMDDGVILLKIRKKRNTVGKMMLIVDISDNGCGFDPESLIDNEESDGEKTGHTGIRNIRRRLLLNYGSNYNLTLDSSSGHGTQVTLSIPLIEEGA